MPLLIRACRQSCGGYATQLSKFPTYVVQIQWLIVCLFWYHSASHPSRHVGKAGEEQSQSVLKSDEGLDLDVVSVKRREGGTESKMTMTLSEILSISKRVWFQMLSDKSLSANVGWLEIWLKTTVCAVVYAPPCSHWMSWCPISAVNKTAVLAWQSGQLSLSSTR